MPLTRRKTLALIGGGTIFAATATAGTFLTTRTPTEALAPWAAAGTYSVPRKRALSYAILAPNPLNRQPWIVDLSQQDQVTLYVDNDRLLPHTDPLNRQIVIGLGCFLEVLRMAALEDGYTVTFDLFPEGSSDTSVDKRPVAVAKFTQTKSPAVDPLFAHVLARRTQKEPYDLAKPVSDKDLLALESVVTNGTIVGSTNDPAKVKHYRQMTEKALFLEIETPRTYQESVDLYRIGKAEILANPDGIDFPGPLFDTLRLFGMFSRKLALDRSSTAYASGIDAVLENARTAMAHIWLVTKGNNREEQIAAGRDWVRLNLATTQLGIAIQPLSQPLQEYSEMAGFYAQIHKELAPTGGTVQMFARLGYCAAVPQSPRWPLETRILNG